MIFDRPQWLILIRGKGDNKKGRQLYLYKNNSTDCIGKVSIYMPAALYSFIYQVCKVEPGGARLYLERVKDRWVFGVETQDSLYDLWAYTPSTVPLWLKRRL